MRTRHRRDLGRAGEDLAAAHLEAHGLAILERNWRDGRRGEIDIVAREALSGTLVVCEVKTRIGTRFGTALESVDQRKLQRMRRLAVAWLSAHDVHGPVRFDVIGVTLPWAPPGGDPPRARRDGDPAPRVGGGEEPGTPEAGSPAGVAHPLEGAHLDWVRGVAP